jgi:CP family cyanate transporter-like MFS transporter
MAVRTADGGRRAAEVAESAAAMGLGSAPPFLLGYLGPAIRADLDLSRGQLGLLIGLFYGLTGLGSLGTARVAERWGARRCLVVDLAVVVACLAGTALSGSAVLLAITAVLTGAGYSLTNAGTSMAVAATAPPGRAGQDLTVKTAGVPLMATVLAVAGPPIGAIVGWRVVFGGLSALAALAAVAAALVLPGPAARRRTGAGSSSREDRLPAGFLLLPVAGVLFIGGSQPLLSWLVLALTDSGLRPETAGLISAAGTAFGVVAMLAISRVSDRIGPPHRAVVAAVTATTAAVGVGLLWASPAGSVLLVVLGAVLGLVGNLGGAGTMQAVVVDRVPWAVGRAIGLMSAGYYTGALVAPWIFGVTADATGGYDLPWALCLAALLASAVCFLIAHRRIPVPAASWR